jgi:hypothetical protein
MHVGGVLGDGNVGGSQAWELILDETGYEDDPGFPGGVLHFRNSFGERWGQDGYGRSH